MKITTPLSIRTVANGYVVSTKEGRPYMEAAYVDEHVFTTATDLGAFVAQFYAENHPQPEPLPSATSGQPPIMLFTQSESDPVHNPANLSDEVIGVAEGWRLLRKSEVGVDRECMDDIRMWLDIHWSQSGWSASNSANTYRTKIPFGQLDAGGSK